MDAFFDRSAPPLPSTPPPSTPPVVVAENNAPVHLLKSFGILALLYAVPALISVAAAVSIPRALFAGNRISVWVLYFTGTVAPWTVGMVVRHCRNECVNRAAPYMCFLANSVASIALSTGIADYVAIRATVLTAMVILCLVPYCGWVAYWKQKVSAWRLGLFGLTTLVLLYYIDEVLIPPAVATPIEAVYVVRKASYVSLPDIPVVRRYTHRCYGWRRWIRQDSSASLRSGQHR